MSKSCGQCDYFVKTKQIKGLCEYFDFKIAPDTKDNCSCFKSKKYKRLKVKIK